jgi:PAS domain S-box-containing protein
MTLERLRNVSLFSSVLALLVIGGVLLWATLTVNRAISVNRTANQIRGEIQELNYLTVDTILHYEERSQKQWQIKQQALTTSLQNSQFGLQHRMIIDVIAKNLLAAKELYPQLVTYQQAAVEKALSQAQFHELESRIVSRLLGQFQDMNANAARLSELSMQRILSAQFLLGVLLLCFAILISVIVLLNWAIISRKVLGPVRELQKGAELVTQGDLAYRTGIRSTDEVGRLANAFDDMTEKIQTMLGQLEEEIRARIVVEENLLESREQIRAVMETALDAIISADAEGNIVHFNQGAERMFNYRPEAAVGMPFTRLFSSPCPPNSLRPRSDSLGAGKDNNPHENTFELTAMKRDGAELPVEVSTASWSTAKGNFFTMIIRDITFRKVSEERLHRINAELEAFSYSVSHDLRAPLRHIDGFVALLKESCSESLSLECQEYLDYISDSATQMGTLIDDLLAFAQIGRVELHKSWFDMEDLVREVQEKMNPDVRGRRVEYRIDNLPKVFGDRSLFRQVWINLLSNALKYSRTRETARIEIGCVDRRSKLEFYIRDNGVGFDMKYAGKLFGVFHRLHRPEEFEGTGVGLANVQRIVQRHEGRVFAEGKVDQGATFYFTLPSAEVT